jgi:DNA-binding CsgD family transcriptional regulator
LGRKRGNTDYVSIVEASYQGLDSDDQWLANVLQTAGPVLDLGGGLGLSLVQEGPSGRRVTLSHGVGRINDMLGSSWSVIQQLNEETYRDFFYPAKPVVLASQLVSRFAAPLQQLFSSLMQHAGASDLLGMLGYPAPGWAFSMFVAVGDEPLPPLVRQTLQRLRTHVEASLRLRLFSPDAVAVIRPDGKLVHAETDACSAAECKLLQGQASSIERARSSKEREDPHRALALWRALVEGRWSLVEQVDSDGRRHYLAFENAPHVRTERALSDTQARVLELSLQGKVGKEVAYALGLSQASVSTALEGAAQRLGFADRSELVRMSARMLDVHAAPLSVALTAAEHEVLKLLQRGQTNREIASARNSSPNTVANQVGSLMRKTGAPSRRALLLIAL